MWWWFWIWIAFILFLVLLPVGYGSGYRRWGPPYPRYYRDRRGRVRKVVDPAERAPAQAPGGWGWFADLIWILAIIALIWIIVWIWAY